MSNQLYNNAHCRSIQPTLFAWLTLIVAGRGTEIAQKLAKEIPGGIILDQYNNIQNPLAHYYSTFGEIQVGPSSSSSHLLETEYTD